MTPFHDHPNFKPCHTCKERMAHVSELNCHQCKEDKKITKFLAPFKVPEGKLLDEHLFPITQNVLPLTPKQ